MDVINVRSFTAFFFLLVTPQKKTRCYGTEFWHLKICKLFKSSYFPEYLCLAIEYWQGSSWSWRFSSSTVPSNGRCALCQNSSHPHIFPIWMTETILFAVLLAITWYEFNQKTGFECISSCCWNIITIAFFPSIFHWNLNINQGFTNGRPLMKGA